MKTTPQLRLATAEDRGALRQLLIDAGLPVDDLESAHVHFVVAATGDEVIGVGGFEALTPEMALLRSFAVKPGLRKSGVGAALLARVMEEARLRGAVELYLLTLSAAPFFATRGFAPLPREQAPAAVRAHRQFTELCPQSAVVLHWVETGRSNGPDPRDRHPMAGFPQVCFIRNTVRNPNIVIGEYTYYDDPEDSENFERNVLYHYPFLGDKLIIGRFCAIARGARFIMNGANHKLGGLSTYPFSIFRNGWERVMPKFEELPFKGDTVVGNDVWIGYEALIMPGVQIGDGAIIAARAVVTRNVEPYTIVGGNPAQVIGRRFPEATAKALQEIAWWNWEADKITRCLELIVGGDVEALRRA